MANVEWLGRAKKVKHISELTVTGPVVIGEKWHVDINGKRITFTATATTTSNVVDGLQALLAASDAPAEFAEFTWTATDPKITATAQDTYSGVEMDIDVSTDSAAGTFVESVTQAATGPEFVDNVNNWSGGALPADTDNVYFGQAEYGPKYALTALAAVTPALVDVDSTATYDIGLPRINANGSYTEFRNINFQFDGATLFRVRSGSGTSSALMRFDFLSTKVIGIVEQTGTTKETGKPTLNIIGTHSDNELDVIAGDVGIAAFSNESATFKVITQSGGTLVAGPGSTLDGAGSTITLGGGTCTARTNVLTVSVDSGATFNLGESATCTTLNVFSGGTGNYNASGTCTTATVHGTLNCTGDRSSRTFTTLNVEDGATINGIESMSIGTLNLGAEVVTLTAS